MKTQTSLQRNSIQGPLTLQSDMLTDRPLHQKQTAKYQESLSVCKLSPSVSQETELSAVIIMAVSHRTVTAQQF